MASRPMNNLADPLNRWEYMQQNSLYYLGDHGQQTHKQSGRPTSTNLGIMFSRPMDNLAEPLLITWGSLLADPWTIWQTYWNDVFKWSRILCTNFEVMASRPLFNLAVFPLMINAKHRIKCYLNNGYLYSFLCVNKFHFDNPLEVDVWHVNTVDVV